MVEDIIEIINRNAGFFSFIASVVMAMIVYYFNRKMLQLDKKDRERPRIIELLRFCVIPLREWLDYQKSKYDFEELDLGKLLKTGKLKTETLGIFERPLRLYQELLTTDFNSLLERLRYKSEWDRKVQDYNKLKSDFDQKKKVLTEKLEKFLDESPDVKRIYCETKASEIYSFESFKRDLVDRFYDEYRHSLLGSELGGAWNFAGRQLLDQAKSNVEPIIEEIEELRGKINNALESLASLLERIRKRLEKEYNITLSEQAPLISIIGESFLRK
jgi:vacuolar-type H+-ATPase subunit I/STV1